MANARATDTNGSEVYDRDGTAYVTLTQAASRYGVSTEAIRRAVSRGRLTTKRLGPYLFVKLASLADYTPEERRVGPRTRRRRRKR